MESEETVNISKREIELEIQNQVEFKFNEFFTVLKNRVMMQYGLTLATLSQEDNNYCIALTNIKDMINKEVKMEVPWTDFKVLEDKRVKKNKCIDDMVKLFEDRTRGCRSGPLPISSIVDIIESAQKY